MNKTLLGAIGAVALGLSAPASAADLAARPYTKAPAPMVATIYDWSGFYIGINGGGGSSRNCWDFVPPAGGALVTDGCHDATGGTVGGPDRVPLAVRELGVRCRRPRQLG
ncbi:hypothetical protein ACVWXO_008489 [Bradyrhizobium sp. LM2.7]